jgi:hypothetical protein
MLESADCGIMTSIEHFVQLDIVPDVNFTNMI